jgi:DNA end-binding protein Ku
VTGERVQAENKARGYEIGENQFLLVKEEELETAQQVARALPFSAAPATNPAAREGLRPIKRVEADRPRAVIGREAAPAQQPAPVQPALPPAMRVENNRTIEIERFVPRAQIDPLYFDTAYYITPREEVGQEAYAVIRDAMRRQGMVGMGRVTLAKRERPMIIEALGDGFRGITLRYAHEVRSEAEYFADIPKLELPDEILRLAKHIIDTKTADFDVAWLEDRYRTALVSMLREKKRAAVPSNETPTKPSPRNVISLMDALRRSVVAERSLTKPEPRKAAVGKRAAPAKRPPARRRTGSSA